ncbi:MAG: class I SAM-dependent methyltransferase [Chloroflexota bacterium]|nr:class I SAM-dependent methyltransferase [Chloroflexota bacterium]
MQTVVQADPDALAARLFEATLGAMDLFSVYLGDKLGYYRALADKGPMSAAELAMSTSTTERYVREWLEQQSVTGILTCENVDAPIVERRFRLPDGYESVLVNPESLSAMAPTAQIFAGCVKPLAQILSAFKNGGGVAYADYGADLINGQAGFTRPQFRHLLTQEWIPALPGVHARLQADPAAHIADVGMGLGWSSIALAKAFPLVRVDGFDLDEASVAAAQVNAEAAGVADRVTFHCRDAGDADFAGRYDFALAVECIHDMSDPVAVLKAMRGLVGQAGSVLIVDEKVAERFVAPGDDVERFMYGFSILHCLPVGMADQPSVETGTVMREETLRRYASEAGYHATDVLPIAHDFYRFYHLTS